MQCPFTFFLQVDENMITAQKRDAARQGKFYFRKTLKKCE